MRWLTSPFVRPHRRSILCLHSSQGPQLLGPSVGVPSPFFFGVGTVVRVFRHLLEVPSSSLWWLSGMRAVLTPDGFQPSDRSLFYVALSSVSAVVSPLAHFAAVKSTFL